MRHTLPLLLLFALVSCSSGGGTISFTPQQIQDVTAAADQVMADTGTPGVIVGVWEGGKSPLIVAHGKSSIATSAPLQAEETFRIASLTKTFTATVVLQLVDEGALSLDDTIDKYFPEVPNAASITVRMLLGMTSGVANFFYEDPNVSWSYQHEPLRKWTQQELYAILISEAPAFQPGEKCVYSDANYFLLGMLAERVTGSSIKELITNRIIVPLGLTRTSFPETPEMTGAYMHGYRNAEAAEGLEDITAVEPSLPWAGGAMISNLTDLRTWIEALVKGTLLSPALQQERLRWTTMSTYMSYGLGIANLSGFIGHDGSILGYNNFTFSVPEKEVYIITIVNKCNDVGNDYPAQTLFLKVAKILYPDLVPW
jgi:D-alanyl-D-alanine carboxypeptidase